VVPWARLVELIAPHYLKGKRGRPPMGIERMLRVCLPQQWYGLADEALEDTIYDSQAMRTFAGIDLGLESVPDATTLLKFRHLLEEFDLTRRIFEEVGALLTERKLLMREGTLVDATIIAAPSSTKSREGKRDPAMHQTKKGNQWYFGMKAHIGADAASGLVHSVEGTAANESEISQTHKLLHGEEKIVHADAGYTGVEKRAEIIAAHSNVEWRLAARRSKIKEMPESWVKDLSVRFEKLKAQTRGLVEHPFHIIKNLFKHRKTRYRGMRKKTRRNCTSSSPWPIWSPPSVLCWVPHEPGGGSRRLQTLPKSRNCKLLQSPITDKPRSKSRTRNEL
jgi:transposase, IS5 family